MTESHRQLSKYTAIFAGGTMLSRMSGLIRTVVMGHMLPAMSNDAFWAGFRFPNMLRDIVGEGASNAAFVPVLSETLEQKGEAAFRELVSALMSAMILVLGAITILGFIFMPSIFVLVGWLQQLTGQEVSAEQIALMKSVTRWVFPYIFFIGLTVYQMGPLFILRHYSTPSWSPALLNVCLILACWKGFSGFFPDPVYALVAGVWLGGISQFLVQYIALGRRTGAWIPNFHLRHPGIRAALWLWVPVILGQSAGEVNKVVDTMFAASMAKGTITALSFANIIVQLPLAMFGLAISAAILPSISRAAARQDFSEVRGTLMYGFRQSYFLIMPAIMTLIILPMPIVSLLFKHGQFSDAVAERTAVALAYYAAGLLCFAWVKIAVAGFYAVKKTLIPVTASFASMVLNIGLIFLLAPRLGYRGLALATTLSYTINIIILYVQLCRLYGVLWDRPYAIGLLKTTLATAGMSVVLYGTAHGLDMTGGATTFLGKLLAVAVPLAAAGLSYLGLCLLLRVPELDLLLSLLKRSTKG